MAQTVRRNDRQSGARLEPHPIGLVFVRRRKAWTPVRTGRADQQSRLRFAAGLMRQVRTAPLAVFLTCQRVAMR
jgi:hypothetical protein